MKNIYVMASYIMKPKYPHLSHKPGYMSDEKNVSYNEKVQISTKLKDKDLINYHVILDMKNKKIVKNSFQSGKTYEDLIKYYSESYPDYFHQTLKELIPNVDKEPNIPAVQTEEEAAKGP